MEGNLKSLHDHKERYVLLVVMKIILQSQILDKQTKIRRLHF